MKQFILSFFFCLSFFVALGQARNKATVSAADDKEKALTVEQDEEGISIYPNPNYGVFTVTLSNTFAKKAELRVMNVIGNEIYRETLTQSDARVSTVVDLTKFAKGLYYVKIETDNKSTVRRVVVK